MAEGKRLASLHKPQATSHKLAVLLTLTLTFAPALAAGNTTDITAIPVTTQLTVAQEQQAERIGMKLHCPICSGESIAQSQTDISRSMMNQVREMVKAGDSEAQILDTFRQSYGDRILLEPPKSGVTGLLWALPVVLLVLGAAGYQGYLRRASRPPERELTAAEEASIAGLMGERE